jgi:hypothetical protein
MPHSRISAGKHLMDVTGYNWKRLCEEYEVEINCQSPYSETVTYRLENEVVSPGNSIQDLVRKYKVKSINVDVDWQR